MASTIVTALGVLVAAGLILFPEPVTTATGTYIGFALLAGVFGLNGVV